MSAPHDQEGAAPHQTLSLFDAVTMIVGPIVGSGIFGTPALVVGRTVVQGEISGRQLIGKNGHISV